MKLLRRNFLRLAAGAATLPVMPRMAAAQSYPSRPITLIVPYPAGGGADAVARVTAERMRAFLGQSVIIENVGGASGGTGTGRLARAAPDGYTLGIGNWSTHVVNAAVSALPYDVQNDFVPVALLVRFPYLLVAKQALPANNLAELIAWLKANPNRASAGTAGVGSGGHLAGILFQSITDTRFQHVPYRGNTPALQDLLAGQIDFTFADQSALHQERPEIAPRRSRGSQPSRRDRKKSGAPRSQPRTHQTAGRPAAFNRLDRRTLMPGTRRTPLNRKQQKPLVSDLALDLFDEMAVLPCTCSAEVIKDCRSHRAGEGCPGCTRWWELHPLLRRAIGSKMWHGCAVSRHPPDL